MNGSQFPTIFLCERYSITDEYSTGKYSTFKKFSVLSKSQDKYILNLNEFCNYYYFLRNWQVLPVSPILNSEDKKINCFRAISIVLFQKYL